MVYVGNLFIILLTIIVVIIHIIIDYQHSTSLAIIYIVLLVAVITIQYKSISLQLEANRQRASKHFTFDLMDNLPIGVISYDQHANITFINDTCQNLLGISHAEVVNKDIGQLEHLPSLIILNNIANLVLSSNKVVYDQQVSLVDHRGNKVECRIYAYPLVGHYQNPGVICIISDNTAELNYINLKRISDTILRDMEGAVLAVDGNLVVTVYNQLAERVYGRSADEAVGKSIKLLFPNYQKLTIYKALTEKRQVSEEVQINIEGQQVYMFNKADVLLDEGQNVVGAICVGHDITEVKRKHELMLKQEKLATVGQMAAGITHELRNPLTAIRGFAQLLNEKASPQDKQLFDIMLSEIDRMEQLVQDFLQLSRPKEPKFEPICINQVVEKLYSLTKNQCKKNNIQFTPELKSNLPQILADDNQITQLLLNLIRNAMEAVSDREPGIISIKTDLAPKHDGVVIQVTDNGQGISPENLDKLGMPFFTTKEYGTGLGLAVCYTIVKQHGGTIQVDSKLNEGTRFKIFLPTGAAN